MHAFCPSVRTRQSLWERLARALQHRWIPFGIVATMVVLVPGRPVYGADSRSSRAPDRHAAWTRMVEVHGRLIPVGGGDLGRHRVEVMASDDTSAAWTSTGTFTVRLDTRDRSAKVQIDAASTDNRRFHPALFQVSLRELAQGVTVLMIPFEWTIRRGQFAGEAVPISMQEALYAPETALPPFLDGEISDELYRAAPARWDPANRPIPVTIRNATPDARTLTARDSAWVWAALDETEAVFGRDLFRPAQDEFPSWDQLRQPPDGAFGVVIDTVGSAPKCTGGGYRRGEQVWKWPPTLAKIWQQPPPAGYTADGVRIRSAINVYCHHLFEGRTKGSVLSAMQHEILHALGFGHGCMIPSHLAYRCEPQTRGIRTFDISPHDVAYWELRDAVFDAVEEHESRFGFLPALLGERALVHDLRPVPSPRDWSQHTLPVPRAPDDLTATIEGLWSESPRVALDWAGDFSIDSRSYKVYRDTRPIESSPREVLPVDTLEAWSVRGGSAYRDASVRPGETYYYRVTAFYADHPDESAFSGAIRVTIPRRVSKAVQPGKPIQFADWGVAIQHSDSLVADTVHFARLDTPPSGSPGLGDGDTFLPYRFVLRANGAGAGTTASLRVRRAALGDLEGTTGVSVLRREAYGSGSFESVSARYDPAADVLVVEAPPSGEFAFERRSEAPAELAVFNARVENGQVVLQWRTTGERQSGGFEVQRRVDGRGPWQVIGVAEAAGASSAEESYFFSDTEPAPDADSLSYRLRLLRSDGAASFALSDSVTVSLSSGSEARRSRDDQSEAGSGTRAHPSPGRLRLVPH